MQRELSPAVMAAIVAGIVVAIAVVYVLLANPLHRVPPMTSAKPASGPALPTGPPPADQIRHGPIANP